MTSIKWAFNSKTTKDVSAIKNDFSPEAVREARNFHRQIPGYKMTPLVGSTNLAKMLELGGIWTKDESKRLDLNAFKVLGGSYAVYKHLEKFLGKVGQNFSYQELMSEETRSKLGTITFATATDGNHGKGIAWAAHQLGHKSVIYVHEDTSIPRIRAIESYGAKVVVIKGNYDDSVRQVYEDSVKNGWTVISDTSWEGYTEIPTWIMQGYSSLLSEAQEQLAAQGIARPTHVFAQAGVGALAGAVVAFYAALFPNNPPTFVIVEPDKAACMYDSILAADGKPHSVKGKLDTIMAGLACGDPSPLAWEILKNHATHFASCPDYAAARGMRIYASPVNDDPVVISGESGAIPLGALVTIMTDKSLKELKESLALDSNSHVLLISTEGNTDPIHYREILWEGSNSVPKEYWTEK